MRQGVLYHFLSFCNRRKFFNIIRLFLHNVFIDCLCCGFARTHSKNNGCQARNGVTACINSVAANCVSVYDYSTPFINLKSACGGLYKRVEGDVPMDIITQSASTSYSLPSTGTGHTRPDSSGFDFILAENTLYPAVFTLNLDWVGKEFKLNSFLHCVLYLFPAGGQLVFGAADELPVTSAPRRFAVRAASIATLPPPTITAFLACITGVALSVLIGFHKVTAGLKTH